MPTASSESFFLMDSNNPIAQGKDAQIIEDVRKVSTLASAFRMIEAAETMGLNLTARNFHVALNTIGRVARMLFEAGYQERALELVKRGIENLPAKIESEFHPVAIHKSILHHKNLALVTQDPCMSDYSEAQLEDYTRLLNPDSNEYFNSVVALGITYVLRNNTNAVDQMINRLDDSSRSHAWKLITDEIIVTNVDGKSIVPALNRFFKPPSKLISDTRIAQALASLGDIDGALVASGGAMTGGQSRAGLGFLAAKGGYFEQVQEMYEGFGKGSDWLVAHDDNMSLACYRIGRVDEAIQKFKDNYLSNSNTLLGFTLLTRAAVEILVNRFKCALNMNLYREGSSLAERLLEKVGEMEGSSYRDFVRFDLCDHLAEAGLFQEALKVEKEIRQDAEGMAMFSNGKFDFDIHMTAKKALGLARSAVRLMKDVKPMSLKPESIKAAYIKFPRERTLVRALDDIAFLEKQGVISRN